MYDRGFLLLLLLIGQTCWMGCTNRVSPVEQGPLLQVLHKGNGQDPEGLDPHLVNGLSESQILSTLLEGLVGEDPESGAPVPATAERWSLSGDRLNYTFRLRHNARWSNGDPVRAHDFVFSYKRMLSPRLGSSYAYMLYGA